MVCAQCGARRPPTGLCPNCGAPPNAGRTSMRDWRERSGAAVAPPGRGNSGARWGQSGGRGNFGANWGRDADDGGRSGRYRSSVDDYQEVDLERALVPNGGMLPAEMGGALPGMPGGPMVPGMPSEEDERLLGIRRPVYIPALGKKKYKIGGWRVVSGVLSIVLMCVAAASVAGFFGQKYLAKLNTQTGIYNTPGTIDYTGVPATPAATAGPANKFITSVVTAKREQVDSLNNVHPADITSKFLVNDTVYVFVEVRNAPKGTHSVCAQWYINGQDIRPSGQLCDTLTDANETVVLQLPYPQVGVGKVRIFWDRPTNDTDPAENDPTLAATLFFGVYMPATPTPVPTKTTKPSGTTTPNATASPAK